MMIREKAARWSSQTKLVRMETPHHGVRRRRTRSAESPAQQARGSGELRSQCRNSQVRWVGCTQSTVRVNLNVCPGWQEESCLVRHTCRSRQQAGVAQLVEHLICNQRVGGSNPFASSRIVTHERAARRSRSKPNETRSSPRELIPAAASSIANRARKYGRAAVAEFCGNCRAAMYRHASVL